MGNETGPDRRAAPQGLRQHLHLQVGPPTPDPPTAERRRVAAWGLRAAVALWTSASVAASRAASPPVPRIVEPADGATVHDNSGNVRVVVRGVGAGFRVQAWLDDAPASDVTDPPVIGLEGVARGRHRLRVIVLDRDGREVARTAERVLQVWQASRLLGPKPP